MRRLGGFVISSLLASAIASASPTLVEKDFAMRAPQPLSAPKRTLSKISPVVVVSAEPVGKDVKPPVDRSPEEREQLRKIARAQTGAKRVDTLDRIAELSAKIANAHPTDGKQREIAIVDSIAVTQDASFASFAKGDRALARLAHWLVLDRRYDQAKTIYERLISLYPQSLHVFEAQLYFGERAFDQGDFKAAAAHYEKVAASDSPSKLYARYKLGWVAYNLQDFASALESFLTVATAPGPRGAMHDMLRRAATSDAIRAYAEIGAPDKAFAFAERLAKGPQALELVRKLAEHYADQGKARETRALYLELAKRETKPTLACLDHVGALRASTTLGSRPDTIALAEEAAKRVARGGGSDCGVEADAIVGDLALAWHRETRHADARALVAMWTIAAQLATTPERKAASARNCAIAVWLRARQGTSAGGWIEAAEVLARSSDGELAAATIDAWDNAIRVARAGAALTTEQTARVRAGLEKIATPRAKSLLATL